MAVSLSDFLELLSCNYIVQYNIFDSMGNSVLKEEEKCSIEERMFPACGFIPRLLQIRNQINAPILLSTSLGIYWIAAVNDDMQEDSPETAPDSFRVHVLGPFAEFPFERSEVSRLLNWYLEYIPHGEMPKVMHSFMRIPVVSAFAANQYALMFYYCLKNRKCSFSDIIHMEQELQGSVSGTAGEVLHSNTEANLAYTTFQYESELIQAVRNGDMNILVSMYDYYKKVSPETYNFADPVRYVKDISILFLAHTSRAAIEGGLFPEIVYELRRRYLKMIEQSQTIVELTTINTTSFEDFVTRVHKSRLADSLSSREVLYCQEYIRLHIEENLSLAGLAEHFHYTVYYFSRKFKEECGISITDYIKQQKTERAKLLLKTTQLSVTQISEQLSFESVNAFCAVFRKCTGMSPTTFRKKAGVY